MGRFNKVLSFAAVHALSLGVVAACFAFSYYCEPYALCRLLSSAAFFMGCLRGFSGGDYVALSPLVSSIVGETSAAPAVWGSFSFDAGVFFRELIDPLTALSWCSGMASFFARLLQIVLTGAVVVLCFWLIGSGTFSESGRPAFPYSRGWVAHLRAKSFLASVWAFLLDWLSWFLGSLYCWLALALLAWSFFLPSLAIDALGAFLCLFRIQLLVLPDLLAATVVGFWLFFRGLPLWAVLIAGYFLWVRWMFSGADGVLYRLFMKDRAFVKKFLGVLNIIKGLMRAGKTKKNTSFGLLKSMEFRDNCYANMDRIAKMYPDFPYEILERDLLRMASSRFVVNHQQAGAFVYWAFKHRAVDRLYHVSQRQPDYFTGNSVIGFRDALAIYAESYFVYSAASSLICSNYGVRDDAIRIDRGHLVVWDEDLTSRDNRSVWSFSMMSHILIWDSFRFGRKQDPKGPFAKATGPSVVLVQEGDKERGNQLTNVGLSLKDDFCNAKNDLFDYCLKLGGHLDTIWHECLFCVIIDTQRLGALSQGITDVAQNVFTADHSKDVRKSCLHGFYLGSWLLEGIVAFRDRFYRSYRASRADRGFLFGLVSDLGSLAYRALDYIENRYGYDECHIATCTVTPEGDTTPGQEVVYYSLDFIDCGERYVSTCMDAFLNYGKKQASVGFFDTPVYRRLMPSKAEWDASGSYLVSDLEGIEDGGIRARYAAAKAPVGASQGKGPEGPAKSRRGGGR